MDPSTNIPGGRTVGRMDLSPDRLARCRPRGGITVFESGTNRTVL
jgi:hypothetical protein